MMYDVRCMLYAVRCMMYAVFCMLYAVRCTLYFTAVCNAEKYLRYLRYVMVFYNAMRTLDVYARYSTFLTCSLRNVVVF